MVTRRRAIVMVAGAALLATAASIVNGFTYDDVPIIAENVRLQSLRPPWEWYAHGYWPREEGAANYRPFTMWMFNLQWQVGGGAAMVFHVVNTALAAANAVLVLLLAWQLLPPAGALAAGLVFAVHPVHVEATGNVVGQAELWMTGAILLACVVATTTGSRTTPAARMVLVIVLLLAASAKEQGILLPAFLGLLTLATGQSLRQRISQDRTLLLWFALVGVSFLLLRTMVVGGIGVGDVAPGLRNAGPMERLVVAVSIVPETLRLLVWPARLSAEYLPPMVGGTTAWSWRASVGALILLGAAVVIASAWRRRPILAAAMLWILLGWLPVSNLLTPTGILLAERTLYLPSVGMALLAGWAATRAMEAGWRRSLAGLVAVVTVLGILKSAARQRVWHDNRTLFTQMVRDAPRSYRTHALLASVALDDGDLDRAAALFARADSLWPRDPRVLEDWAHLERRRVGCMAAIPLLERALTLDPDRPLASAKLRECRRVLDR